MEANPDILAPLSQPCKTETSTVRFSQTTIVTVTERPAGIPTCICTLTGIITSQHHAPTITPDIDVIPGRPFYQL